MPIMDGTSTDNLDGNLIEPGSIKLMRMIENIFLVQLDCLVMGKPLVLHIRDQKSWNNIIFTDKIKLKPLETASTIQVNFNRTGSQQKYSNIIHILAKVYELLINRSVCTVRELYYQDVSTFKAQRHVDSAIRSICCMLDVPSWELGVIATSKGLIVGPLIITTDGQEVIDCNGIQGGVLVPQTIQNIESVTTSAKLIVLVEKDATFQKLVDEGALERLNCLLITGKGYPDTSTRLFVHHLWKELQVPIWALVDADPHGIDIMCVYRFGSLAMSHQADLMTTPAIRWLGIHPSDIEPYTLPTVPLTKLDYDKLANLLDRPYVQCNPLMKKELLVLKQLGKKAEIEGVASIASSYLTDGYLPDKIKFNDTY